MGEFRKILTPAEIRSGSLCWGEEADGDLRRVLPQTLVFDMVIEGRRLDHLAVEWEKRELYIGEPLMAAVAGAEFVIVTPADKGGAVSGRIILPNERILIKKRLSQNEHRRRLLKWYAREDHLYRRLFSGTDRFDVEIAGKRTPGHPPDFEKRQLIIGEALRSFNPGDTLRVGWMPDESVPTLFIAKEELKSNLAKDGIATLRSLVMRLISRPLGEFNEGEVKALVALLDENKTLWERLMALKEENEKLKEQLGTLESVFEQFSRNSFFNSKSDFENWVSSHIGMFERGIRLLHKDYLPEIPDSQSRRIDLLCQDRKGVLVAVEIVFNPESEELDEVVRFFAALSKNAERIGNQLTEGRLSAGAIRAMIVSNRENADLVERCLQNDVKLCVVNSGCVIDALE